MSDKTAQPQTKKQKIESTQEKQEKKEIIRDEYPRQTYEHPLEKRYSSKEMSKIWSDHTKFTTWRRIWVAIARAQLDLGLKNITKAQVDALESKINFINYEEAEKKEKELRHDVMSHIYAFGLECPEAKGILHLGATSCDITDNAELIQIKQALILIQPKLLKVIELLSIKAKEWKGIPTLGFTHFQPAQLTTVGKRVTMWLQDFFMDWKELERVTNWLPFRGIQGTTGTQASFLELFDKDQKKVKELNDKLTKLMGFENRVHVSGQTYSRKIDHQVLNVLNGIAQSAHKMCTDIRLLMHSKEMEEPFEKDQVGSSAMAYKRNPMRSERVCSLSRYVMSLSVNPAYTHAVQWLERTLDDSANRRLIFADGFLATDGILNIVTNIVGGLVIWPKVIEKHIKSENPFMATELILMESCKAGGDRQQLHHQIRDHSMEAGKVVKEEGKENDLLERIAQDQHFSNIHNRLGALTDPKLFIGRAEEQVDEFLIEVQALLHEKRSLLPTKSEELRV